MRCGRCHEDGQTLQHVRNCYGVMRAREALAATEPPPEPPRPKVTLGHLRRQKERSKQAICWACDSTDVGYFSLNGKTLRCCPEHPKTTHPDYKEPSSEPYSPR